MRIAAARRAWTAAALPRSLAARGPWLGGARASMCNVPDTVPHWGGLDMTEEEIDEMAAELRANYLKRVHCAARMRAIADYMWNCLANPRNWLDNPFTNLEERVREMEEKLTKSILADQATLLDGIEDAYRAVVDEFTSEEPDFDRFVERGAMGEECAELLSEILSEWTDEGLRPVIKIDRVKTEIVSSSNRGRTMIVLITSREAHRTVPAASAAASARAKVKAKARSKATAEAKSEAKYEYRDVSQLWHLTAEISPEQEGVHPVDLSELEWELTDINFICFEMEVPAEPPELPETIAGTMAHLCLVAFAIAAIPFAIYRVAKSSKWLPLSTPLEQMKPLAKEREGVQKTESNEETVLHNQ
ncbi:hypothetical protein AB1Y20_013391 [Prymnesium parvum]|uniref:Tim44-like domain-containing protein n=1 Tax=Prymnesium parvum TaxID=97485 RepID=A0AB34II44_PRYPA